MRINPGEQFAAVVFRLAYLGFTPAEPLRLGPRLWVMPGPPFQIDEWWRRSLGDVEADQIEDANLSLVMTAPSATPHLLDGGNAALVKRVQFWLWGIALAAGPVSSEHAVLMTGGHDGTELRVRQVSNPERLYRTAGLPEVVGEGDIFDGVHIMSRLELLETANAVQYRRLARGVNAFIAGLGSRQNDVRLHQFVRSIESFLPATVGRRDGFASHVKAFLLDDPDPTAALIELYNLRSVAEHLGEPPRALPSVPAAQRQDWAMRRLRQAEALVHWLYRKVFTVGGDGHLDVFRTDESIARFWAQPLWVRRALWGERFDFEGVR